MDLGMLFRHNVRLTFTDGETMEGYVNMYISELDNDPDPESIVIGNTIIAADEIENAEILD